MGPQPQMTPIPDPAGDNAGTSLYCSNSPGPGTGSGAFSRRGGVA